jgi:hypothetical protein
LISIIEAVNQNLRAKLSETIEHTNILLNVVQSYEHKAKDTMQNLLSQVEQKFTKQNEQIVNLAKKVEYFKVNSTKVNYFYNNMIVKQFVKDK